jgi:hypothetical protein
VVRKERLELSRLAARGPKPRASAIPPLPQKHPVIVRCDTTSRQMGPMSWEKIR